MEVYTVGVEFTPVIDPLIIHINGQDYYLGRRDVTERILVWPWQRDDKEGSIITSEAERNSDPYKQRFGRVLEIGKNAFYNEEIYPAKYGPPYYVGDWVVYTRYENQIWGMSQGAEKQELVKTDGVEYEKYNIYNLVTDKKEEVVLGKIRPEFIIHSLGPDINPKYIDSTKHVGR